MSVVPAQSNEASARVSGVQSMCKRTFGWGGCVGAKTFAACGEKKFGPYMRCKPPLLYALENEHNVYSQR